MIDVQSFAASILWTFECKGYPSLLPLPPIPVPLFGLDIIESVRSVVVAEASLDAAGNFPPPIKRALNEFRGLKNPKNDELLLLMLNF